MRSASRPGPVEYLAYSYGRVLPPSMNEWVTEDLVGKWSGTRMITRLVVPVVLGLGCFWLVPADLETHLSATLPIFVPYVITAIALNRVYRRHRLTRHGLDPKLLDRELDEKSGLDRAAYEAAYRNRDGG